MTPEQLSQMSDEEKRIKIAELCGWKESDDSLHHKTWRHPDMEHHTNSLPNYLKDLNAIYSAEISNCMHIYPRREMFGHHLMGVCRESGLPVWMATAAQRADAFLLTKG